MLHCHHYSPFVYGALARLRQPGLQLIYTEHGRLSAAAPSRKRRLANTVLGRLPARFFAVSNDLKEHMVEGGLPRSKVGVIHNGIEPGPEPGAAERATARRRLELPLDALVVGTIARLDPVKNLGLLLGAFRTVAAERPDARLVVIGDGPERGPLERTAREGGVERSVVFTGGRDDARALLPAFDVFANSSTTEGISVTILEAMAASLPVVATRVGGNPEVVDHGETGTLTPAGDDAAMASAIGALLDSPDRRFNFGAAGRRRLEASFSFDRMVARYLDAYLGRA